MREGGRSVVRSEEGRWEVGRSVEMLFIFCPCCVVLGVNGKCQRGPGLPPSRQRTDHHLPTPPHHPLPPAVIERLRALAKKPRPLLRPSARYSRTLRVNLDFFWE